MIGESRGKDWPEVFVTGIIPENMTKNEAMADMLVAQGNCYSEKPGDHCINYGQTIVDLANKFDIDSVKLLSS